MEIRHADLQIEVEDAEDGGVRLHVLAFERVGAAPAVQLGVVVVAAQRAFGQPPAFERARQLKRCRGCSRP